MTKAPNERAGFLRRLGIYLLGVALGFLILGMFRERGKVEAEKRAAQRAAAEAQSLEGSSLPASSPGNRAVPAGEQKP